MKTKIFFSAALFLTLITAAQAQTIPAYLPADGLVGWWPFNGNANDESGNGNDGTVNGATLTADRFGNVSNAFTFDGINDYLSANIDSQSALTVSLWYNSSNPINWYPRLIGIDNIEFLVFAGNNPNYIAANSVGQLISYPGYISSLPFIPNFNDWHHVTVMHDHNTGDRKLYIDNELRAIGATTEFLNIPFGNIVFGNTISGTSGDGGAGYLGQIDDIAIYNRALSQEEITALYTGEPVSPPTACNPLPSNLQNGLVGYWPFCGNANDESGNGNNGTVNGATLTEDRFGVANAAYDFDGVDDWVDVLNNQGLNSASGSVSAWLKSNGELFNDQQLIFGHYQSRPQLTVNTNNNQKASISWPSSIGDNANATSTSLISSGEWICVIGTYSSNSVKIYINGVFESELITELTQSNCFSSIYNIGGFNATNQTCGGEIGQSQFFNGNIDDIGIWNRALTAEEVQELYTLNACTFSIYDTTYVTIYDTVSVSTTDTLIINTLITNVQPAQENTFLVYPNPAGSQITINNGNVSILGGYTMRISNSIGQEVYNQNITQTEVTLDLSNWGGNGLYVLYILDPQGEIIAVKQIVLQ